MIGTIRGTGTRCYLVLTNLQAPSSKRPEAKVAKASAMQGSGRQAKVG